MKCIKALRKTKDVEIGEIKRVDDKTANNMVGNYWAYVAKSEWKKETRKSNPKEEVVQEKNQPEEKKPYKKGERSEKHKNKQ